MWHPYRMELKDEFHDKAMAKKPRSFDPNSNEHLEWVLKLAYLHASGDVDISSKETTDALCDAISNIIGPAGFCEFLAEEHETNPHFQE